MIVKVCQFHARSEQGERLVEVFHPGDMEKAAAFFDMEKRGAPLLPEVQRYLQNLKPNPNKIYVLVNALGAGEYWGSNINGDYFPEGSLIHTGPVYGYETFYQAHPYKHHVNKDPSRSFGRVELSVWHDGMKRVELVVRIDRDLAARFGAQDVCDKIDHGMFPDVSMGCLPEGSPVFRADGRRVPIETIKEGDSVLTHKGRPRRVTSVMARPHKGSIYHVKAYGHRDALVLTGEHPLWLIRQEQMECRPSPKTVNRGRKQHVCTPDSSHSKMGCAGCSTSPQYQFEWVRTDEACEGDYLAIPVPNYKTNIRFTADQARLLGYYLSEGLVLRTKAGTPMAVQFCTNLWEIQTHAELYQLGERLGLNVTEYDAEDRNGKYISIWDRSLAELCSQHCGEKALTKRLSSDLISADVETLLLLLGAYANGDGGCYKGSLYFSTASEELSEQLRLVLARCGMIASVNELVHKPSKLVPKETVEFQVWVGTDTAWKLTTAHVPFGKSDRLCSKRFFYTYEGVTYLVTPIESVEETPYDGDVYNFGVEEDESYQVEGLAVHNCKVPYDICSVCTDWAKYRDAQATYEPSRHKSAGAAVLEFHRKNPIRGISVTRNDYCTHLKNQLNKILEDGRKVYAINDYPRFFDISFVFIGADKTAKVMAKLASGADCVPSWYVAEQMGYDMPLMEKEFEKAAVAGGLIDDLLQGARARYSPDALNTKKIVKLVTKAKERMDAPPPIKKEGSVASVRALLREKRASHKKGAEITKDVVPSQFGGKAVPVDRNTPDLPNEILDRLGKGPLEEALSTPSSLGMLLRPREFQRITIISIGRKDLADKMDEEGKVFPPTSDRDASLPMGGEHISDVIKKLLLPFLEDRSYLEPVAKRRMARSAGESSKAPQVEKVKRAAVETPFLRKISAAYNGYLDRAIGCFKYAAEAVNNDPELWEAVFHSGLADGFEKQAEEKVNPAVVLGAIGGGWALSEYARRQRSKAMQGNREPVGPITDLIAEYPKILMVLAGLGALHQQGSSIPRRLVGSLGGFVKDPLGPGKS